MKEFCYSNLDLLTVAAMMGHVEVMDYLMEKNAVLDSADMMKWTALHWAVHKNNHDAIHALVMNGADVDVVTDHGDSALHMTALSGDADIVQYLLDHNADTLCRNKRGWQPLHYAVYCGNLSIVRSLLHETDVNSLTYFGESPLGIACVQDKCFVINELLENGAKVNHQHSQDGNTALHYAVMVNSTAAAIILMGYGADATLKNKEQQTPLQIASLMGYQELEQYLTIVDN